MQIVQQAQTAAMATQRALEEEQAARSSSRSFLSAIKDMLLLSDSALNDEYSPEERLKVLTFLNTSMAQFSDIFKVCWRNLIFGCCYLVLLFSNLWSITKFQINPNELTTANNFSLINQSDVGMSSDVTDSYSTPTSSHTITYRGRQSQVDKLKDSFSSNYFIESILVEGRENATFFFMS